MPMVTSWSNPHQWHARLSSVRSVTHAREARNPSTMFLAVAAATVAVEGAAEAKGVEVEAAAEAVAEAEDAAGVAAAEAGVEAEGEAKSEKTIPQTPPQTRNPLPRITHKSNAISAKNGAI